MPLKSTLPSFASDPDSMLRQIRRARELSIPELANRSKVPIPLIRHWERTNTCPDLQHLRALATALHVRPAALTRQGRYRGAKDVAGVPAEFIAQTQRLLLLFPQH